MIYAVIYYPRLDCDFTIYCDSYTDLVHLINEFRGCEVLEIGEKRND